MNLHKTQTMSPIDIQITIDNQTLQVVKEYIYLGHNIRFGKDNLTTEINRRIGQTWAAFTKLGYIFKDPKIPINLKRKIFNTCVMPITTYGLETTITLIKKSASRIRVCQGDHEEQNEKWSRQMKTRVNE